MNKIKEAIANLRSYLGRDQEGIRHLDEVTKLANEMRKKIASLNENIASAIFSKETAQRSAIESGREAAAWKKDLEREQQIRRRTEIDLAAKRNEITQLQSKLKQLEPDDLPPLPDELACPKSESPLLRDPRALTDMFNTLRRGMRICPRPIGNVKDTSNIYTYELTDIISSYNADDLLRLGRFVATIALMNFPAVVVAQENFTTSRQARVLAAHEKSNADSGGGPTGRFVRWFRTNIGDNHGSLKYSGKSGKDVNGFWIR